MFKTGLVVKLNTLKEIPCKLQVYSASSCGNFFGKKLHIKLESTAKHRKHRNIENKDRKH